MILSGWGNYPRIDVPLLRARGEDEIRSVIANNASLIARGNGRAYGDAALNRTATISILRSDRILAFDPTTGLLTCEAGLLLGDLLDLFVPRGWFVPVTPGTKFVTVGGMIAADVHGKNHHIAGSFGNYIESLTLMLADGRIVMCSATENSELFAATRGGMGLTGIIVTATFRLRPIETAFIRQQILRASNLAEAMETFENAKEWTYSVAWIDCLAHGDKLGRSLIYLGEHARRDEMATETVMMDDVLKIVPRKARCVPFDFPGFVLNRWSTAAFNAAYYAMGRPGTSFIDYETFFYPLDALQEWNRMYGRRGFVQYQCVLPKVTSAVGIVALLDRVARSGLASFLAVLKLLGPGSGFLSFPMEGYTLTLDFPVSAATFNLLKGLDAIVVDYGGRIYLAKDSCMDITTLRQGYPCLDAFLALRRQYDPEGKFSSLQSERLGL